jgi:hypothetical protein
MILSGESHMRDLFYRSFEKFLALESNNILSGVSERNLCNRLGFCLEDERKARGLEGYYVDAEYNRQQNGQVKTLLNGNYEEVSITCDLILHSRGESVARDNLIAIEMKKSSRPGAEKKKDRIRLIALTKKSYDDIWSNDGVTHPKYVCGYELGIFIELDIRRGLVKVEEFQGGAASGRREFPLAPGRAPER